MLADKVSANLVGMWLLVPEHLRLGTWDALCAWAGQPGDHVDPRLALQLVHEAALCTAGTRSDRSLTQTGFELLNGLPFLASDTGIHQLLETHSVSQSEQLQVMLGKLRLASGHYRGQLVAVDPHRMPSYSKRHMRYHRKDNKAKPAKMGHTFWALDAETEQPVCFLTGTASRSVADATPDLLDLASHVLHPRSEPTLVMADAEHFTAEIVQDIHGRTGFDLLVPMSNQPAIREALTCIPPEAFTPRWAGYATHKRPYQMKRTDVSPLWQLVQRCGERPEHWSFQAFLATRDRPEVDLLAHDFPKRWHIEEFFNKDQDLGWKRAGTMNLNVRYGQMTMALVAQAVLHQLRQRVGEPVAGWNASHLAKDLLRGLQGDVRVREDTIIVTFYNPPNAQTLRHHYENLPAKLEADGVDPAIPWLYGFKLDFRFR